MLITNEYGTGLGIRLVLIFAHVQNGDQKKKRILYYFKIKVLSEVGKKRKRDICKEYNLAPSTLSTFLKDKSKILKTQEVQIFGKKSKRMRKAQHEDVEDAVFIWFKQARANNIPINGPVIMAKADSLAQQLGVEFNHSSSFPPSPEKCQEYQKEDE